MVKVRKNDQLKLSWFLNMEVFLPMLAESRY
jgi:hypothetical protein